MKLLIINQPLNNRGDESAHRALVRALHANLPNVEIRVLFWKCNEVSIDFELKVRKIYLEK